MARPPSADSIIRNAKQAERKIETHANIASGMILPNNSGDHTKGIKRDVPINDYDLVNKKYVDDEIGSDHPHQDVQTTASPTFVKIDGGEGYFYDGTNSVGLTDSTNAITSYGDVVFNNGDIKQPSDTSRHYFGLSDDAYIEFDGSKMNIIANAVTATDDMYLQADGHYFTTTANTDIFLWFVGTSHTGLMKWDESADTFQFNDKVRLVSDLWTQGNAGFGRAVNSNRRVSIQHNTAVTGSSQIATNSQIVYGAGSASNTAVTHYALFSDFSTSATYSGNMTNDVYGYSGVLNHYGSGDLAKAKGMSFQINNRNTGNLASPQTMVIKATSNLGAGSVTGSPVGLYLEEQTLGTTPWQVYSVAGNWNLGTGNLETTGRISTGQSTFSTTGPTDNVDVSGINSLLIDASSNTVTIGGFTGGVAGQILHIVLIDSTNHLILENEEGSAYQDLIMHQGTDEEIDKGGVTMVCDGTDWFDCSHA